MAKWHPITWGFQRGEVPATRAVAPAAAIAQVTAKCIPHRPQATQAAMHQRRLAHITAHLGGAGAGAVPEAKPLRHGEPREGVMVFFNHAAAHSKGGHLAGRASPPPPPPPPAAPPAVHVRPNGRWPQPHPVGCYAWGTRACAQIRRPRSSHAARPGRMTRAKCVDVPRHTLNKPSTMEQVRQHVRALPPRWRARMPSPLLPLPRAVRTPCARHA